MEKINTFTPDYWELVKRLAEKHNQKELIQIAESNISAIEYTNKKITKQYDYTN